METQTTPAEARCGGCGRPCGPTTGCSSGACALVFRYPGGTGARPRSGTAAEEACGRCGQPFDPDDKDPAGAARYGESRFCKACIDRCHESTDAFHECPVCAST